MSQPAVELRGLLRGLHEHEVQFIVFGSLAMVFYGFVRNSEDLDLVVEPSKENLNRVADWLISLNTVLKLNPERKFGPRERWGMHKGSNATVITALGQVDLVQRLPGLPEWPELVADAEWYELEGNDVRVMNRSTLIALKRRRSSPQDLVDIETIEQLEEL